MRPVAFGVDEFDPMTHLITSHELLDDPPALRKRLRDEGYLFLREFLPREDVLELRRQTMALCRDAGWLRPGTDPMDGLTDHPPLLEGEEAWRPTYAKLQALEPFHRLKLDRRLHGTMEDLFQEPAYALPNTIARIAFPRDNERGTQPHQDWYYVGGSTEIISCWVPMGDIPEAVGGLRVLAGSHKAGFLRPREAGGPGGYTVDVDPTLTWHQSDYRAGDLLMFKALTIHASAPNHTPDVLRLSMDFRYTGESHAITADCLKPHFFWLGDPFSWEVLDRDWRDSPTARYWERIPNIKTKEHHKKDE